MGDTADNIPGIPGIGEKTALKLLGEFNTLENVLSNTDKLKGKLKEKVENNKGLAIMSKELATIRCDVDIEKDDDDYKFKPNYKRLVEFLELVEMNSIKKRYEDLIEINFNNIEAKYEVVTYIPEDFLNAEVAIFFDDNNESYFKAEVLGLALNNGKRNIYIYLKDIISNSNIINFLEGKSYKIGYDIKRNLHLANSLNLNIKFDFDVMISSFLCNSTLTSLDKIVEEYNLDTVDKNSSSIEYSTTFSKNIIKLYEITKPLLKEYELESLFYNLEMPLKIGRAHV